MGVRLRAVLGVLLVCGTVLFAFVAAAQQQVRGGNTVTIGRDVTVPQGETRDSVVAVFGSTTIEGQAREAAVAVFGDTRVLGPVGDAAVAVLGDLHVNSRVDGDAVVVLGNAVLGPGADIDGNLVVIGGTLRRDAAARVAGDTSLIGHGLAPRFDGLRAWFNRAVLYGRPLAFDAGLKWAWAMAVGFVLFYVLLAAIFRGGMTRCVETLERHPGRSAIAALLTLLLTPLAFLLMALSIVGIALLPFLWFVLFCIGLFGKAAVLATVGRRITGLFGEGGRARLALATLIGGIVMLLLYVVPVIGFIVYALTGILGAGVVLYALLLETPLGERVGGAAIAAGAGAIESGDAHDSGPVHTTAAPVAAAMTPGEGAAPLAGFWVRMGALAIDALIILAAFAAIDAESLYLLVLAGYGTLMWKFTGTTVGGMVCRLRVVRADGRPMDWQTAIVRGLACILSAIIAGLGFIWIAVDRQKQGWHDKIAGTLVVRTPQNAARPV